MAFEKLDVCTHRQVQVKNYNTFSSQFLWSRTWGHSRGYLLTDFPCGPPLILIYSKTGSNLLLGHHCLESLLITPFITLQIQVQELVELLICSLTSWAKGLHLQCWHLPHCRLAPSCLLIDHYFHLIVHCLNSYSDFFQPH